MTYSALCGPEDLTPSPLTVKDELACAQELLDEVSGANIHDHHAMIDAAVRLEHRLRGLVAALDAERGERA